MNQSSESDSFYMPVSVIHKQSCIFKGGYLTGEWILHKVGGLVCLQNPILSCCNCSLGFTTLASNVTSVLYKHHRCFLISPTIASCPFFLLSSSLLWNKFWDFSLFPTYPLTFYSYFSLFIFAEFYVGSSDTSYISLVLSSAVLPIL